ncbi:hypothetical protein GALMADRAFT_248126 [Galerina marginata CBS 339.88]|uniref:Uncharacterized protein n=1 Tax=Galerina marginata (strain CBS 339.88) TaxID=685588 RepID=A0A067T9C8_GALM3|nr:hypothetical protein GALMADRAFT_248126 [Galerina marginata CBS 339.88]
MDLAAKPGRSWVSDITNNHVYGKWHALRLSMEPLRTTQEDRRDPATNPPCMKMYASPRNV